METRKYRHHHFAKMDEFHLMLFLLLLLVPALSLLFFYGAATCHCCNFYCFGWWQIFISSNHFFHHISCNFLKSFFGLGRCLKAAGLPISPASRILCTNGTSPKNGTFKSSASVLLLLFQIYNIYFQEVLQE